MIPKQSITYGFGAVKQSKNRRGLMAGELIEATNVRQVIEDAYRKRPGYDRTVPTGSPTTPWESYTSEGKRRIARDSVDNVWSLNGSAWEDRGAMPRAFPTISPGKTLNAAVRPVSVRVGDTYWVFTIQNGAAAYSWAIFDLEGGIVKAPATQAVTDLFSLAAETDGTYVWVVVTTTTGSNPDATSHRYTIASPTTAPTTAVYDTIVATGEGPQVDMHRLANGDIAVAIASRKTSVTPDGGVLRVSYLDTTTGAAKSSPATVELTIGGNAGSGSQFRMGSPSIFLSDGSNGFWYLTLWGTRGGLTGASGTKRNLWVFTITAATLAIAYKHLADGETDGAGSTASISWSVGYLAANGDRVVYATSDTFTAPVTRARPYVLTRYTYDGSTVTTTVIRRYSYPVSKPQLVGSKFYLMTGFDDGSGLNFQKAYYLIDSDGNILTQAAYGQAGAAGLRASASSTLVEGAGWATPLRVNGSKLQAAVLFNTGSGGGSAGVNDHAPALITFDLAATYGPPTRIRDGLAGWPSGVPVLAGTSDNQREIAIMQSPLRATLANGSGSSLAGPQVVQYVYRMTDSDGSIYRSAPSIVETTTFTDSGATIEVIPLTHLMPGVTAQIEIYVSGVNSVQPVLHIVAANDTTTNSTVIAAAPTTVNAANETIYTFGGGIENAPLPASKAIATWRNRLFFAVGSELWPSLEREAGLGPRFNETFITAWDDGEGDIIAIAPVDWSYLALFKRDAIAVVSGGGPVPTAGGGVTGNYETQTLRLKKGAVNPRSVISGPNGAYFQSLGDGRFYCVTPGLEIVDVSQGMESYRAETVVAVNYVDRDRHVHFHMSSGAILVLDTAHPTPDQPFGRWSRWYTSGLLVAAGATVDSAGAPSHLETTGAIRTQGSGWKDATSGESVPVLMALETGDLAYAGKIRDAYRIDGIHIEGEWIDVNSILVTVTSDFAESETVHESPSLTELPEELYVRPRGHERVRSTRVRIEEIGSAGEGFVFEGLAMVIQPRGKSKFPSNARRAA